MNYSKSNINIGLASYTKVMVLSNQLFGGRRKTTCPHFLPLGKVASMERTELPCADEDNCRTPLLGGPKLKH